MRTLHKSICECIHENYQMRNNQNHGQNVGLQLAEVVQQLHSALRQS